MGTVELRYHHFTQPHTDRADQEVYQSMNIRFTQTSIPDAITK